jgi:hypothetical protein
MGTVNTLSRGKLHDTSIAGELLLIAHGSIVVRDDRYLASSSSETTPVRFKIIIRPVNLYLHVEWILPPTKPSWQQRIKELSIQHKLQQHTPSNKEP